MLLPEESASTHSSATDDHLVELARTGSASAYGELWRRHAGIGRAIARRYYEVADADDIVSESFARILSTLQRGGGPRSGFRPYLITTIGNVAKRWATRSREGASDELDLLEDPKTVDDPVVASTDREFALQAFRSLPDRWQAVLWYSAVEGLGPTEVARYLGMTPNAAAVLAHRARAGLRTAWIQAHLNDSTLADECRFTSGRLGRHAAGSLGTREHDRVRLHLNSCAACRARARELDQLTAKLAALLIPALLGIGLVGLDSDDSAAAAAAFPEASIPTLTPTHLGLTGIAAAAVVVAALFTSPTSLPVSSDQVATDPQTVHAASDHLVDDVTVEPTGETAQSVEPERHAPAAPSPIPSATPDTTPVPTPVPIPSAVPVPVLEQNPPPAPVVVTAIDPAALRPPTLTGSASPNAAVIVTDELGLEVTQVWADADGSWSTGELSALSPAASRIFIRQIDEAGLTSAATAVGPLAARPRIATPPEIRLGDGWNPFEGFVSYGMTPFDIGVDGWPGATVDASFIAIETLGHTAPTTYSPTRVVLDAEGHGVIHIDGSEAWFHRVMVHYVDGARESSALVDLNFGLTPWPD